jgi:hypothetical protein
MNAYRTESSLFRPVFGAAAVALTALTVSLAVVVPAHLAPGQASTELAATSADAHVTEVAIIPARIDVIGVRARSGTIQAARSEQVSSTTPVSHSSPSGSRCPLDV